MLPRRPTAGTATAADAAVVRNSSRRVHRDMVIFLSLDAVGSGTDGPAAMSPVSLPMPPWMARCTRILGRRPVSKRFLRRSMRRSTSELPTRVDERSACRATREIDFSEHAQHGSEDRGGVSARDQGSQQVVRRRAGAARRLLRRRPRRGPRHRRRERGRQEHADEDPQWRAHRLHRRALDLDGEPLVLHSPRDAQRHGIAIIYQELNLIPELTVAENIFLGRELHNAAGLLDTAAMDRRGASAPRPSRAADLHQATGQDAARRRAATRRGRQGVVARRPPADPRRADVGAQRGGDPPSVRRHRRPEGRRRDADLHLPQVRRGLRDRRSRHRAARRRVHRHGRRRRHRSASS